MRSRTEKTFRKLRAALPRAVRLQADIAYRRWKADPFQAGLEFKRINRSLSVYSVRVGRRWRALGRLEDDAIAWFWIGSHEAYNTLLSALPVGVTPARPRPAAAGKGITRPEAAHRGG
jgi:hypothetical protein